MSLGCAADIDRYIGGTVRSAFEDPHVGPLLARHKLRVRLGFVEPDCVLDIDTADREVRLGRPGACPGAFVAMTADTANRLCLGRLDVSTALESGEITHDESGAEVLEAVMTGSWFPRLYADTLKRACREDLAA